MYSEILSTVAIALSVGSFGLAARTAFLDRSRLKVTSIFSDGSDEYEGKPHIYVQVVNRGRRPVILRLLGGFDKDGGFGGTVLEHDKGGLRLGEHERHAFTIYQQDAVMINQYGPDEPYVRMAIEDAVGNRYSIPRSREYVPLLFPKGDSTT